jgi:ribosomal protein L11 methyltransferase
VPYRIELRDAGDDAIDRLVELGALDVDHALGGGVVALMPDHVTPDQVAPALGSSEFSVAEAVGRDADSVWVLSPRPTRIGRLQIVPAHLEAMDGRLRLIDGAAFGTGLHPTTALCLEALNEVLESDVPDAVLDVGTGSGVLALAALTLGVRRAVAIDIDQQALRIARENARINGLSARMRLACGGPEILAGMSPLVLANVLAAPLIEMAPVLVRRVARHGRLVLSGIPRAVEADVDRTYRRLGMRPLDVKRRGGWSALMLQPSW